MKRGKQFCGGLAFSLVPTLLLGGCGDQGKPSDNGEVEQSKGRLEVRVASDLSRHDVAAVKFKVLPLGSLCDGTAIDEETVAIAPAVISGADYPWTEAEFFAARTLFVLAPGQYTVCMMPLTGSGAGSNACPSSSANEVNVTAGGTTSVNLVSQCQGSPTGGIAVTGAINDPPQIVDVKVDTSNANPCQQARLAVNAVDPNGDSRLVAEWSVKGGPGNASISRYDEPFVDPPQPNEQVGLFADTAGVYEVEVTVRDMYGAAASLTFPVHVSESSLVGDTCILTAIRDLYMDSRHATDNYGCSPYLEVGTRRGDGGVPSLDVDASRILVHFPIRYPWYTTFAGSTNQNAMLSGGVPPAEFESAILEMTILGYEPGGDTAPYTLNVYAGLGPQRWPEGRGIETQAGGQKLFDAPMNCVGVQSGGGLYWDEWADNFWPAARSTAIVDPTTQGKGAVVRWDVTSLVQDQISCQWPDGGFFIADVSNAGENRGIRFGSREQIFGFPPEYTAAAPRLILKMAPR